MYFDPKVLYGNYFIVIKLKKSFRNNHGQFISNLTNLGSFVYLAKFLYIPYLQNEPPSHQRQSTAVVCCVGDAMGDCVGLVDEDGDISARRRAMGRVELFAAVAGLKLNRGGLLGGRAEKERRYCTGCVARSDGTERGYCVQCRRCGRARCWLTSIYLPPLQLSCDIFWFY